MRTLIVPCADDRMISGIPLILQRHPEGMLIAEKAIDGIFPQNYDRIIYTILAEFDEEYHVKETLLEAMSDKYRVDVLVLQKKTSGPAETIYRTLLEGNVTGEIAIKDSHSFINLASDIKGNFIAGLDLMSHGQYIENLRSKSFIVLNEQKQVLDVIEKRFCSDFISIGLYGFRSDAEFRMAYERLNNADYPIKKLYVSHIISYLIGYRQRIFHSIMASDYEEWGTLLAWRRIQKKYSTCFLDLDRICGCVLPIGEKVIECLQAASRRGCRFIAYSVQNIDTIAYQKYFEEQGIHVLSVVSGCTASGNRVVIEDFDSLNALILEV